jgi:hypothetical protein
MIMRAIYLILALLYFGLAILEYLTTYGNDRLDYLILGLIFIILAKLQKFEDEYNK